MHSTKTIHYFIAGALIILVAACKSDQKTQAIAAETAAEEVFNMIDTSGRTIDSRFRTPIGYERIPVEAGSFGAFSRNTLLRPADAYVFFYNGKMKFQRNVYDAVIDWDVTSNAMTGIDCVTWFHSEYCYKSKRFDLMAYPLNNGFLMDFEKWTQGYRSVMENNEFRWEKTAEPDSHYFQLRNFQDFVFAYADSKSAKYQCEPIAPEKLGFGTTFISEDKWGHGVIVVDVAENASTGDRIFLLAQSFVPAQEMQILQNPTRPEISPWYSVSDIDEILVTPEWTFKKDECFQFKGI